MADETVLNNELNNETVINSQIIDGTIINPALSELSTETVINTEAANTDIIIGSLIDDGFVISEKMNVKTGEADLYICDKGDSKYVLKVYRRDTAVKEVILEQLKEIDSPYIARLIGSGVYEGHPYEIIPFYSLGSLQGKKYTLDELKDTIIPELNEALHELHSRNIVHKDLKPSNIMLQDNGKDISIIDFGISSMKEEGNTIVLTRTGFTPDYTAHEAFNGLFLNESDYYSLGITIYELYTGTTPYKKLTAEQIELYTSVQKIPLPEDMEEELKDLIVALTYYDITNRKDKNNPNRRWTYDEVKKWINGEKQIIPGSSDNHSQSGYEEQAGQQISKYIFMGTEYTDRHKLAIAFAKNWNEAKKDLFNGILSARFKEIDQAFAVACMDAEEAYGTGINSDLLFFRILYKLDDSLEDFIWKGQQYNNLVSLGKDIQDKLWKYVKPDMRFVNEILNYRIISEYLLTIESVPEELKSAVAAIETGYIQYKDNVRERKMNYYLLGYLLSGRKIFYKEEHEYESVEELVDYLKELLKISYIKFEDYCASLIGEDGKLDVQLETWLMSLGMNEQIAVWKQRLS